MRRLRAIRRLPPIALVTACQVTLLAGQSLRGTVVDETTQVPLPLTEVVIPQLKRQATSDSTGAFVLAPLPAGWHRVVVRRLGYAPLEFALEIRAREDRVVDLELHPAPVRLDALEVTEDPTTDPFMRQFYQRRRFAGAMGSFIGPEELRVAEHGGLSDVLRTTRGIRPVYVNGKTFAVSSRDHCPMQVFLDGARLYAPPARLLGGPAPPPLPPPNIDLFHVSQLEAIEVYAGPAETPAEFSGTGSGCGTLLLWTRRR